MANYYNLDAIKTEMKKDVARDRAILAAWECVTFPTKKDGKPFAILSKNIDGARITHYCGHTTPDDAQLTVYTSAPGCGYVNDDIYIHNSVHYLTDEQKTKPQNIVECGGWPAAVYAYDLDDVKKAVADRIASLRERVASLERQLAAADAVFYAFRDAYKAAAEKLASDCEQFARYGERGARSACTLERAVVECVTSRYPYI